MIHLISTSAHINDKNRCEEYIECYKIIYDIKHLFESITIIETISKKSIDYLENSGLNVFYSKLGNPSSNKGTNWLNHVSNFLLNSTLNDDDIIIFITGRYRIVSKNIISLIENYMISKNYEFLAKEDTDLYPDSEKGVHTFFMVFTKSKFLDLSDWYQINGKIYNCVEWDVKEYLKTHDKCIILPKDTIMGVETRILSFNNKIC
jgi:hypothetical protein